VKQQQRRQQEITEESRGAAGRAGTVILPYISSEGESRTRAIAALDMFYSIVVEGLLHWIIDLDPASLKSRRIGAQAHPSSLRIRWLFVVHLLSTDPLNSVTMRLW
jgi:hypothetical protein